MPQAWGDDMPESKSLLDGGHSHSIRRVVTALVIALVVIVSVLAVHQVVAAWENYANAEGVIDTNQMVDDLLQAAQNLAFERGRTNVVLRGAAPIDATDRKFLDDRRAAADRTMIAALARLMTGLEQQGGAVRSGFQRVQALRVEADAAMARPLAEREAGLTDRWFSAMSGLLSDIAGLNAAASLRRDRFTSEFRILSRIKGLAFDLRNVAGVESTRIASAMAAGKALSFSDQAEIMLQRGQVAAIWSGLRREVGLSDNLVLTNALEVVTAEYFGKFRPLEDAVLTDFQAARPASLATKTFTAASVPALDSIAALMSVANRETNVYAEANLRRAKLAMAAHLTAAILAIGLGLATILVTVSRLLSPLHRIQTHLAALAVGTMPARPRLTERGDEIGQMQRAVAALHDSVEVRQQVEGELRAAKTWLELVLQTAGQAIFGIGADGRISFANHATEDLLGLSSSRDLVGQDSAAALNHRLSDGHPCADGMCFIRTTLKDGRIRRVSDEYFTRSDGTPIPVEYVVSPQLVGQSIVGAVVVAQDIGERLRAERENRDLLARQKAVLENTPIGIAIIGLDRRIMEVNDAFRRVFGRQGDSLIGESTAALYADSSQYDDLGSQAYPVIQAGEVFEAEIPMKRGDGDAVWVRIVAHLVDVEAPERGVVWAAEDVSRRKSLELEIKRSNQELERFAYVASHDLRQPLRMVGSYLTLLERRMGARLDEEERQFLDYAVDGARRMDSMIVDLLEYSRIGRMEKSRTVVSLAEVMGQAVANLQAAIADSGAELTIPANLPQVVGTETELVRLFQNLLGNAIKFRLPDRTPKVSVECLDMEREWVISVTDNGIGIAPQDHGRLFNVFQRLVTQDEYEGTGIGLAVCRKICESNGGRIWVKSQVGEGASFLVALPKLS